MSPRAIPCLVVALALSTSALGQNVWTRASRPDEASAQRVHERVEELFAMERDDKFGQGLVLERARGELERAIARDPNAITLQFDLGIVESQLRRYPRAIERLERALSAEPDHPMAARAWDALGTAYAHVRRYEDEAHAYQKYLALVRTDSSRAVTMMNLAETKMYLGDLDSAIEGYREANRLAVQAGSYSASVISALCMWGLAVALDRSGDRGGARSTMTHALGLDPNALFLKSESVFFVPDYERDWYLGLAALTKAMAATSPSVQRDEWQRSFVHWDRYISGALADKIPSLWVARAMSHRSVTIEAIKRIERSQLARKGTNDGKRPALPPQ